MTELPRQRCTACRSWSEVHPQRLPDGRILANCTSCGARLRVPITPHLVALVPPAGAWSRVRRLELLARWNGHRA